MLIHKCFEHFIELKRPLARCPAIKGLYKVTLPGYHTADRDEVQYGQQVVAAHEISCIWLRGINF